MIFFLLHVLALTLLMVDTGARLGLDFGRCLMLYSILTDMVSVLEGPWRATWEALSGSICLDDFSLACLTGSTSSARVHWRGIGLHALLPRRSSASFCFT